MSAPFIQMPDHALAEGFAHHVVHWARESNAPGHTLALLAAAARATTGRSLAMASSNGTPKPSCSLRLTNTSAAR